MSLIKLCPLSSDATFLIPYHSGVGTQHTHISPLPARSLFSSSKKELQRESRQPYKGKGSCPLLSAHCSCHRCPRMASTRQLPLVPGTAGSSFPSFLSLLGSSPLHYLRMLCWPESSPQRPES